MPAQHLPPAAPLARLNAFCLAVEGRCPHRDCESALQQKERTQCALLEKQLRLIGSLLEEVTKQRNFEVSEAAKFVEFQTAFLIKRESQLHEEDEQLTSEGQRLQSVSWAFPSCTRSILTEVYLCHACFLSRN
jgi:hypothetical protein